MIKVGTSGFQYEDWIGSVYPQDIDRTKLVTYYEERLGFETVELNYTFYALPAPRTMESLLRKTSADFDFVVRSHKEMTHDLWADPSRTRARDTGPVFKRFREGLAPLRDAHRLGCVLVQFPYDFCPSPAATEYLARCRERLDGLETVVEFRHRSWLTPGTFAFLRSQGLGFCNVDEPKTAALMPMTAQATSGTGYVRLHGRNERWFGVTKEERYHYNYTDEELSSLIPEIRTVEKRAGRSYVFFNNCSKGFAAKNALTLKSLLAGAQH